MLDKDRNHLEALAEAELRQSHQADDLVEALSHRRQAAHYFDVLYGRRIDPPVIPTQGDAEHGPRLVIDERHWCGRGAAV